jgi:hypothetical protein
MSHGMHPTASPVVVLGIAGLALLVALSIVIGYARTTSSSRASRLGVALAAWIALTGALGASGVLQRWDARPPPLLALLVVGVVLTVALARSAVGSSLARGLPLAAIIGFQAFRLPLELVMHRAAAEGTMPVQMSFSGWNFDIVSGATALLVAWLVARGSAPRWLAPAWAVMSSALLLAIVSIAIASMPAIAAFGRSPERLTTWVGYFPFVWLPAVLVMAALFGQIVLFRRLAAERLSGVAAPARPSRG